MTAALAYGFALGWIGSMPIAGAVSVFVCQRGLAGRVANGLALAVGAALAEAAWCLVVLEGAGRLFARWPVVAHVAKFLGGALLVGLGIYFVTRHTTMLDSRPPQTAPARRLHDEFRIGASLVAANLAIPVNWLALLAVAVTFGMDPAVEPPLFALGVALGVVAWFAVLLRLLSHLRQRISAKMIDRVMHGLGILLAAGGLVALGLAFR